MSRFILKKEKKMKKPKLGIDANYDLSSYCGMIKRAGYSFVGRYYCNPTVYNPKRLTYIEAQHISNMGLRIVSVYETYQTSIDYFIKHAPEQDAKYMTKCAIDVKQPPETPIYYAVDFDCDDVAIVYIIAYLKHLRELIHPWTLGLYGNGAICHLAKQQGIVSHTWLSMSSGWYGSSEYYWRYEWDIHQSMYPNKGSGASELPLLGIDYDIAGNRPIGDWSIQF
jgi:hypothetical protein